MSAYKIWRIFISAVSNSSFAGIGEVQMAETPSGVNECVGGTATASSSYSSFTPDKAFNGIIDSSNLWHSGSEYNKRLSVDDYYQGAGYIQYEFTSPKDIKEIRIIMPEPGTITSNHSIFAFSFYSSNDGAKWTRHASYSNQIISSGETRTYETKELPYGQYNHGLIKEFHSNTDGANSGDIFNSAIRSSRLHRSGLKLHKIVKTPYTGIKRIAGSTTSLGVPMSRRVDLVDQASGLLVRTIHTGEDGVFEFTEIADTRYSVVGVDNSLEQNSVIFANVTPVD